MNIEFVTTNNLFIFPLKTSYIHKHYSQTPINRRVMGKFTKSKIEAGGY